MTTESDKSEVKAMIQSLYRLANISPAWDGEVNEEVAAVFGIMIAETRSCSNAFGWVPNPSGGRATITWVVRQLGRGVFNAWRGRLSLACARTVIYKWKSALELASDGIAMKKIPKWA